MTDLHTGTGPEFAAHIGIHWADQKHFWTMRTADGKTQRGELDNTPEAVQVWAAGLEQRFGGRRVAVALEQARGAVIAMLCKYAHLSDPPSRGRHSGHSLSQDRHALYSELDPVAGTDARRH